MYKLIFYLSVVTLFSCRPANDEDILPPGYTLEEPVLVRVLTDCYLGEGATGVNVKNLSGEKFDSGYVFNPFKDNNITKAQLDTTIAWYAGHPAKLKLIYNKVLDNLSQILAMGSVGVKRAKNSTEKYIGAGPILYLQYSKTDSVFSAKAKNGYELKLPLFYKSR